MRLTAVWAQPASTARFQTHPRTSPSPQAAGKLRAREEGARWEAADPPAPTGLLNEWAASCCASAWGQSQVYTSTKRNIRDLTVREWLLQRGQIPPPFMKCCRSDYRCLITATFLFQHWETELPAPRGRSRWYDRVTEGETWWTHVLR